MTKQPAASPARTTTPSPEGLQRTLDLLKLAPSSIFNPATRTFSLDKEMPYRLPPPSKT